MTEHVTKVLKRGIVVIPKALRSEVGLGEGDLVVMRRDGDRIIIEPLERMLTLVTIDHKTVDKILREAKREERLLESEKMRRIVGAER